MDVGAILQAIAQMGQNLQAGAANASKGSNETVADARTSQPAQSSQPAQQSTAQAAPAESSQPAQSGTAKSSSDKTGEDVKQMAKQIGTGLTQSAQAIKPSETVVSDERLKEIFGSDKPIECFGKIHSYTFRYTPEAQKKMQGKEHVDNKEHFGVMAQELAANPLTESVVIHNPDGHLSVDTPQLTMVNTAMISELARNIKDMQTRIGVK
jgi:hypothetical protein